MNSFNPSDEQRRAISSVFDEYRQVLIELRLPGRAISPEYYLLDDEDDLSELLSKQKVVPIEVRLIPAQEIGATDGEARFTIGT